jgi:citrate synthase
MAEWLSASEVLESLGVRPQTLYAYVSRGRIEARADPIDPRKSLYRAVDVNRLVSRKARGRKAALVAEDAIAWGEPVLASAITTVSEGRLYYRGRDAALLAQTWTLENTARLLRGGDGAKLKAPAAEPIPQLQSGRARAFAALAARAGSDAPARGRAPLALAAESVALLDVLADAVAGERHEGPIHARLAAAWGCDRSGAELVRKALVLLADHELNASTFAARVAASTGASLAACALAGLSALSGPLHGGMATRVVNLMAEVGRVGPEAAVSARLANGMPIPGFGHPLYPGGDPRAAVLLSAFTPPATFEALREAAERLTGQMVNVDFALTALAEHLSLPPDAAFLMFASARCAGWLAHALEQLQTGRIIRPRARYVGPPPA